MRLRIESVSKLREAGWFRHALGYGVFGVLQLVIDWACFVGLTAVGVPTPVANPIARAVGALFGYLGNGRYTFRDAEGRSRVGGASLRRFIALWLALTVVSTAAMWGIETGGSLKLAWAAKPVVDVLLAGVAFLITRAWVFR